MTALDELLARNQELSRTDAAARMSVMPSQQVCLLTCLDPRVDPAAFLGLAHGEAVVLRNAGGRVTPAVIRDVTLTGYISEHLSDDGSPIEIAVIHHTGCGLAFLADDDFRADATARTGLDEDHLRALAAVDPVESVTADVRLLLAARLGTRTMTVSGHVLDLATGLVRTVVTAQATGTA